jgi:hypothetical protein
LLNLSYEEYLKSALGVYDDLGYKLEVIDGKRVIHFSKILLSSAITICKDIIKKDLSTYKMLKSYIHSITNN